MEVHEAEDPAVPVSPPFRPPQEGLSDPVALFAPCMQGIIMYGVSIQYILIKMEGKGYKRVGKFRISEQVLGRGSFSTVYAAYDDQLNKVAAKVIPISSLKGDQVLMLEREITALHKCKHENVVALLDVKKSINNLYIFMEYCEEGSLADVLERRKKMEEGEALGYFFQILKGMQVMAVNKIIHRDLKPPNIMVKNGVAKIADFGLARGNISKQFMETFVGSPLHMAPQILRGEPYTQKVDVYSVGIILYQMLFGSVPFRFVRNDYNQLLLAKDKGFHGQKDIKISSRTESLIKKMLEPNPQKRISMNGVLDFMDAYVQNKREEKLTFYKKMSLQSLISLGAMGSIIGAMSLPSPTRTPSNMDLRLYGTLCQRLTAVNN